MLTLAQIFGANAYQDGQVLVITKSDLPLLTPSDNNTSESLLVAILLHVLKNFIAEIATSNNLVLATESGKRLAINNINLYNLEVFKWETHIINRKKILFIRNTIVIRIYEVYEND